MPKDAVQEKPLKNFACISNLKMKPKAQALTQMYYIAWLQERKSRK
jgi:hypothetical protein